MDDPYVFWLMFLVPIAIMAVGFTIWDEIQRHQKPQYGDWCWNCEEWGFCVDGVTPCRHFENYARR